MYYDEWGGGGGDWADYGVPEYPIEATVEDSPDYGSLDSYDPFSDYEWTVPTDSGLNDSSFDQNTGAGFLDAPDIQEPSPLFPGEQEYLNSPAPDLPGEQFYDMPSIDPGSDVMGFFRNLLMGGSPGSGGGSGSSGGGPAPAPKPPSSSGGSGMPQAQTAGFSSGSLVLLLGLGALGFFAFRK